MTNPLETYGFLFVSMLLGSLLGLSVYLPLMAGQLSLASPGFYAIGGYIAAILSTQVWPVQPFPLALVLVEMAIAGLVSGLVAIVLGLPVLRLRGIYLAIATIAFVEVLRVLALNFDITGGAVGIFGIPQPVSSSLGYLWLVLPSLVLAMLFCYRLERSRTGLALAAIREDELAADAMGINPTQHKVLVFVFGAILAGIVGAISAHFLNTWNARQGTFDASIAYLAFVLSGGSRTFVGPVVGGMFLTALPEILRGVADSGLLPAVIGQFCRDGRLMIFGLTIVIVSIFYPQGVITPQFLQRLRRPTAARPTKPS